MSIGTNLLNRLVPSHAGGRYEGQRLALWLLALLIALKLAMSVNSILNTAQVAQGADGIPLDSYGPTASRQVLLLFALMALGHLFLTLMALAVLVRWRALVPFIFLMLLLEQGARRLIAVSYAGPGAATTSTALIVNVLLFGMMGLGLILSVLPRRQAAPTLQS